MFTILIYKLSSLINIIFIWLKLKPKTQHLHPLLAYTPSKKSNYRLIFC